MVSKARFSLLKTFVIYIFSPFPLSLPSSSCHSFSLRPLQWTKDLLANYPFILIHPFVSLKRSFLTIQIPFKKIFQWHPTPCRENSHDPPLSSTTAHDFNMPFTSLHLSYFPTSLTHLILGYVKVNYFVCVLCIPGIWLFAPQIICSQKAMVK